MRVGLVLFGIGAGLCALLATYRRRRPRHFISSSPAKVILFGEHAVVYGRPAIAAPLGEIRAKATVQLTPRESKGKVLIAAPDLGVPSSTLADAAADNPLAVAVREVARALSIPVADLPAMTVSIESEIPISSGLGSGAAAAACVVRALAAALGHHKEAEDPRWVSDRTYEVEKVHHGTPSGIDNTVVSFEAPVWFLRGMNGAPNKIDTFEPKRPLHIIVANTGIKHNTKDVVAGVRHRWEADKPRYDQMFSDCGRIAVNAQKAIEAGDVKHLGELMEENHAVLVAMGVSCDELDTLVAAARHAGALGAKMSGGGKGGNMIALVEPEHRAAVEKALLAAGATSVLFSSVE